MNEFEHRFLTGVYGDIYRNETAKNEGVCVHACRLCADQPQHDGPCVRKADPSDVSGPTPDA